MSLKERGMLVEKVVTQNIGRRGIRHLYKAIRRHESGSPTLRGANSLYRAVKNGGNVIIASGFTIISAGRCETDGPIGSVVIGRLLNIIGNHIVFLTEPNNLSIFQTLGKTAGLTSFHCLGFPIEHESAKHEAKHLLSELAPVALIAVERPGWNRKSTYHNMAGEDISDKTAKIDYIFDEANESNILTIGIGDGGNEIGMGNIHRTVAKYVPFGSRCQCPCRGGIASITKVDHLMVASISNWGAYALAALTASLAGVPFRHTPEDEHRFIKAAVEAGAVDGKTGRPVMMVDGLNINRQLDVVGKISSILED